jgi:hypothetical protein
MIGEKGAAAAGGLPLQRTAILLIHSRQPTAANVDGVQIEYVGEDKAGAAFRKRVRYRHRTASSKIRVGSSAP